MHTSDLPRRRPLRAPPGQVAWNPGPGAWWRSRLLRLPLGTQIDSLRLAANVQQSFRLPRTALAQAEGLSTGRGLLTRIESGGPQEASLLLIKFDEAGHRPANWRVAAIEGGASARAVST